MQSYTQDNKLFSFDGKNINFYRARPNGELRLVNDQFEEIKTSDLDTTRNTNVAAEEHATVGDIALQTFFNMLSTDHQKFIEQKLTRTGLASFRRVPAEGSWQQLYVDLMVGSQKIRAGMIVSLGGYFGLPDEPISCDIASPAGTILTSTELKKRFLSAFQTLAVDVDEVLGIVKQIGWEGNTIHGLIKRKAQPSIVMGALKDEKTVWANLTSRSLGWRKHIPGGFFIGRYMQAATMNFDHFGLEAETAYEVGHHLALQMAASASTLSDKDEKKWQKFVEALGIELFACHFFADLFVSGHTRTPRRKVFEILNEGRTIKKKWIAALFANLMHDEDNEKGVYICSENHPRPWEAMGDYRYSDDDSSNEGEVYVHRAVAARLNELYLVFRKEMDWTIVAANFKKDIPREASSQWLDHCQCNDIKARMRALKHAQKFQPFLRAGLNGQLEVRPDYRPITKKEIMLLLADVLAKGITGEVTGVVAGRVKEITRITPLTAKNVQVPKRAPKSDDISQSQTACHITYTDDSLRGQILEELYLMDNADEVILGIEMPCKTIVS